MGVLLEAVQRGNKKIKLLSVTAEIRPERLFHLYVCERQGCEFEFAISQKLEDQSPICCPNCQTDNCVRDKGDAAVMKGVLEDEF